MEIEVPKLKTKNYPAESLYKAVSAVESGSMTIFNGSKRIEIPEKTLRNRMNKNGTVQKPGVSTILSKKENNMLHEYILDCAELGDPKTGQNIVKAQLYGKYLKMDYRLKIG